MPIEREVLRQNVSELISLASAKGIWEDHALDFKRELPSQPRGLAKALKLILAFANTPRNRDAYIIYGVSEDSEKGQEHIGVSEFPAKERLEQLIREYTDLEGVIVDADYMLGDKRTPYIMVPLQYQGPHRLKKSFAQAPRVIDPSSIYLRAGSHTVIARELEQRKMKDWDTWFWDGRYVSSINELETILKGTFSGLRSIKHVHGYLRFEALHTVSDNLGDHKRVILGHAYPGLDILSHDKVALLSSDNVLGTHDRWLICHRPSPTAMELAEENSIRIVTISDLFIANDVLPATAVRILSGGRRIKTRRG
jgi:hypothetical protein